MTPETSHNEFLEALRRFDNLRGTLLAMEPVQESDGTYGLRCVDFRRAQDSVEPAFDACQDLYAYVSGYYAETGRCFLQVPRELRESLRDALTNIERWDSLRCLTHYKATPEPLPDDEIVTLAPHPHEGPDDLPALPLRRIVPVKEDAE